MNWRWADFGSGRNGAIGAAASGGFGIAGGAAEGEDAGLKPAAMKPAMAVSARRTPTADRVFVRPNFSAAKIISGAPEAAPMHQEAFTRFRAAALRVGFARATHKLMAGTAKPRPKP